MTDDPSCAPPDVPGAATAFDPPLQQPPDPRDAKTSATTAAVLQRIALATLDGPTLIACGDAVAEAAPPGDARDGCRREVARLWSRYVAGAPVAPEAIESQRTQAARAGDAAAVLDVAALRTLAAIERGDEAAAALARRGLRMASAEAIPSAEWTAALLLARLRRRAGRPHLAAYILTSLARCAAPTWYPWIAWELALSGSHAQTLALLDAAGAAATWLAAAPGARAARAVVALLEATQAGDRARIDEAADALSGLDGVPWFITREAGALVALLGAAPTSAATGDVSAWCAGAVTETPLGLSGLAAPQDAESDPPLACVIGLPRRAGRRVLRPGARLFAEARALPGTGILEAGRARTYTGLAVLALAGPARLSRDEFFRQVYGFPFVMGVHQALLDKLVHRMRILLGPLGQVQRDDLDLTLQLDHPVVIPDARCALPAADRVLRALAASGSELTAQATADVLRLPLRQVQRALKQLVNDGTCGIGRAGRQVAYRVLDTTFTSVGALPPARS